MSKLFIPKGYYPILGPTETQRAIKRVKDHFQRELADKLNLGRVSAPLFVIPESGLNDNLNGYERRVEFTIKEKNGEGFDLVAYNGSELAVLKSFADGYDNFIRSGTVSYAWVMLSKSRFGHHLKDRTLQ